MAFRMLLAFLLSISMASASDLKLLPGWEGYNEDSTTTLDHASWQLFLDTYLMRDDFGQTYFAYAKVSKAEMLNLRSYIRYLESFDPLELNADEQKAYWINLYNAATVEVVLKAYPVKSIRNIGGSFGGLVPSGPWKQDVVMVNNQALSLDDVEHGILRPKYLDHRIHYAVNCASMGCPNLAETAYTGDNIEQLLVEAEQDFVNHQRGVRFQGGRLIVSKIFDWYRDDFVENEEDLPKFLAQFAEPKLRAQLNAYNGRIRYEYDWALNEVM